MKLDIAAELESTAAAFQSTTYVSVACVVRSRPCLEAAPAGARDRYAGDTGAYLTELLSRFEGSDERTCPDEWMLEEPEPLRIAREAERAELRCIVHRTATDLFVLMIGVFNGEVPLRTGRSPSREHGREGRMRKTPSAFEFVFSFGDRLGAESPALAEALRSLETGLEKYVRLLAEFRGEYIHPLEVMSRGEVMHLARTLDESKRREEIRQKQDEFLDAYLDWKSTHRIAERTRLMELAKQLRELDPSFEFTTLE